MNYLELSLKNVEEKSKDLFNKISEKEYNYDLVVFIAKGAYPIGKALSDIKSVPLLEISAKRKGGKLKSIIKPCLKFIPKKLLVKLREKEMNSSYHEVNKDREVKFNEEKFAEYVNSKKILLVDDSIDSGYSIIETKNALSNYFKDAEIKIAVFNVMSKSIVEADFTNYNDTMLNGPWSNDSKYNKDFLNMYKEWKKNYEK